MKQITCLFFLLFSLISFAQKTELVIRNGHVNHVEAMALSPDKKWFATASEDGSAILWDAATGFQIKQFELAKHGSVNSIAFSKDGKYLAAAADDKVAVIDAITTNLLDTFPFDHKSRVVAFTPNSNYLISCDDAGFMNVWRTIDRKQIARINPYDGMYDTKYKYFAFIQALSISPNGKKLALGDDSYGLVIFDVPDTDNGWNDIIKTRIEKNEMVDKVSFTGGKYLVAHIPSKNYLITYDAATFNQLSEVQNKEYNLSIEDFTAAGSNEFIYARFGTQTISKLSLPGLETLKVLTDTLESLIIYADDLNHNFYANSNGYNSGSVAVYNTQDFKKPVKHFGAGTNTNIFTAASPDGKLLAVSNEQGVMIYDINAGKIIQRLNTADDFLPVGAYITFDKAGKFLYVDQVQIVSQWSTADWKLKHKFEHNSPQVVTAFSVSDDGKYLATVDNGDDVPLIKLWNTATATVVATKKSEHGLEACTFSNDSKKLAVIGGLSPLALFSVPSLTTLFTGGETLMGDNLMFTPADENIYTFNRNAIYATSVASHTTSLLYSDGEFNPYGMVVFAIAVAPDKKSFIINGEGTSVKRCDMQTGVPFSKKMEHAETVRSISYSGDGKFYVTAGNDGQVMIRNNSDEVLCRFFSVRDIPDWIAVMPDGRFDASMNALNNMYFHKATDILPLSSLFEKFYTPHLLPRLLAGEPFAKIDIDINNIKQKPLVKITYAEKQRNLEVSDDVPSYQNTTGIAEITVNASSQDDAVDEIRLFHNGKVLNLSTRNLIVEDDKSKTSTKKYTISLLPGTNEIRAVALNTQRTESESDVISVIYNEGASANTNSIPVNNNKTNVILDKIAKNATLHLVVVGINQYKNPKMVLNYALADATAFKDEVEKDAKSIITNVKTYFVTDNAANKTGITNALEQVQQNAKPQDVFLFYYAGHGVISNQQFYLVPNDVTDLQNVDEALRQNGIAAKDLQQYAISIQAQKQLFILDACQSAGAFADMLSSDGNQQKNIAVVARATGTHWMAASGAQQFANEFSTLGHGAFTYVLLQALKGEAANNKMITVDGLKTYMQNGVPALMKKYNGSQQTPASYGFGNDFPVEVMK